jgi:hypothetical protein
MRQGDLEQKAQVEKFVCLCGECFEPVSKATFFRHQPIARARAAAASARDSDPDSDNCSNASVQSDDSVRTEIANIDSDQFERTEDASSESEIEEIEAQPVQMEVDKPISDLIPSAASVAEISLALLELQRKFKISVVAMERFADLLQIATGPGSLAPKFSHARAMEQEFDVDFRVVDCCVNDDCVFENAPRQCDRRGTRQHADCHKCPVCKQSRYVLVGPDKGKARKQIIVFSLKDTIKMLFAQPGFSQKLNGRYGHPLSTDPNFEMRVRCNCLKINICRC